MKVGAISSSHMFAAPVDAVKRVERNSKHNNELAIIHNEDVYSPSQQDVTEQKYELACRVAAYYKTQYENLLKNGNCIA